MRIKKVSSDTIKLYETRQVKFKTAGEYQRIESKFNSLEVQFTTGNNNHCPIQNISKDKYFDKQTGEIKERKKSLRQLDKFNTAIVVYDARTGNYYYGMNRGVQLSGDTLNSSLASWLPESSLNHYAFL